MYLRRFVVKHFSISGKEVGLEIFRVVKFKIEKCPKADYGKFFSGDSYIVLNTYM